MQLEEFVKNVESCYSFLPTAGLTVYEWKSIKEYVSSGKITNQELFESAKEKIENFERNLPTIEGENYA